MPKSPRNAASANLHRLLNSNTFKATVPTEEDMAQAGSSDDTQPISRQASIERDTVRDEKRIQYIAIDLLLDNPYQPRREILVDDDLREMSEGIKAYDLLGAYPARKHPDLEGYFQIGFGHRRREASRLAGKATMPIVLEDLDDAAMAGLAAVENIHRKDLTDLELGRLFLGMKNEGYTQAMIADSVKKDRGYVVNRLRLAEAPADIQEFSEDTRGSLRAAAYLIQVTNEDDRALLISRLKEGKLTTDDLAVNILELIAALKIADTTTIQTESDVQMSSQRGASDLSFQAEMSNTNELSFSASGTRDANSEVAAGSDTSMRQPSVKHYTTNPDLEAIRISTKLRSIKRSYEVYYDGLMQRNKISSQEQELIHEIGEIQELIMARLGEEI